MHIPVYPLSGRHLGCFHVSAIMNNAATHMYKFLRGNIFISHLPRNEIAESYVYV